MPLLDGLYISLWDIFLTNDWYKRVQIPTGGAISGLVALLWVRKQTKHLDAEFLNGLCVSSCLQVPASSPALTFLSDVL